MPIPALGLVLRALSSRVLQRLAMRQAASLLARHLAYSQTLAGITYRFEDSELKAAQKKIPKAVEKIVADVAKNSLPEIRKQIEGKLDRPTARWLNNLRARRIGPNHHRIAMVDDGAAEILSLLVYGGVESGFQMNPIDWPLDAFGNMRGARNRTIFERVRQDPTLFLVPMNQTGINGEDLSHLHPGIWRRTTGGLEPAVFFHENRRVRPLLPMEDIGVEVMKREAERTAVQTLCESWGGP